MSDSNHTFVFTTNVSEAAKENEFVIEIFRCLTDITPESIPIKVTHNFDELIDFFEQINK